METYYANIIWDSYRINLDWEDGWREMFKSSLDRFKDMGVEEFDRLSLVNT